MEVDSGVLVKVAALLAFQQATLKYDHSQSEHVIFVGVLVYYGLLALYKFAFFRRGVQSFHCSIFVNCVNVGL